MSFWETDAPSLDTGRRSSDLGTSGGTMRRRIAAVVFAMLLAAVAVPAGPAVAATATFQLSPSSGRPGDNVVVSGSGFAARQTISFTWDGTPIGGSMTTSESGTFSTQGAVPTAPAGAHVLGVRAGGSASPLATATFTVLAAPTPPPATGTPVPSNIDATGGIDASVKLNNWLYGLPNGSTIVFKAGATYRMNGPLKFLNRKNLTFEGNGATLKSPAGATESQSTIWIGGGNTGIKVRNFKLVGSSTSPGTYIGGKEGAHGVMVVNSKDVGISNVTVSRVWGDAFFIGYWSDNVRIHDNHVISNGRNGVTVTSGTNIYVDGNKFDRSGYCTWDIEPNLSTEGARNVNFTNNTVGSSGHTLLSGDGRAGSVVDGVTMDGNTVTGGSLYTLIRLSTGRRNVRITNNVSKVAVPGPVIHLSYITGLTVTGNVQPLTRGQIANIQHSTNVVYVP